ncbi:MarR family transcriptional regulator [Gottschalkiaceae bacterium SANA]|nr:MarR family transcriptional regulator [Gottschalkiaceae bacterium SANA]
MKHNFFRQFGRTYRLAHRYLGNQLDPYGLSKGQPRILRLLVSHNCKTQKDLLQKMDIRPATLTRMLQRMEKNGLLIRTPSPQDQRILEIQLTELGREAQDASARVFHKMDQEFSNLMTTEEKETLERVFTKFCQHLQEKEKGEKE